MSFIARKIYRIIYLKNYLKIYLKSYCKSGKISFSKMDFSIRR